MFKNNKKMLLFKNNKAKNRFNKLSRQNRYLSRKLNNTKRELNCFHNRDQK